MKNLKYIILVLFSFLSIIGTAQQPANLSEQIKELSKMTDPDQCAIKMQAIIRDNKIDTLKDGGTVDVLKGTVALAYLKQRQYDGFNRYIKQIKSLFNQTSYMNMGVSILVKDSIDPQKALSLAKETIDLYDSYKDDPNARTADMSEEDWKRFMDFAKYPYYDAYAQALYATGNYKKALKYQKMAFSDDPENGISSAVERYARLLDLNSRQKEAYDLLLKMAKSGKSTAAMNAHLKELYTKQNDNAEDFDAFFASLQGEIQNTIAKELKPKMLDTSAPAFTLYDLDGKQVALSDFKGKVVVLDFWATWCAPCIASFPSMEKLTKRHPEVVFLFIATQEKQPGAEARVKSFIKKNAYPFHVLLDQPLPDNPAKFKVVSEYGPKGIPAKAVIDPKGNWQFLSIGFSSDTELINEMEAMIALAKENS